MPDPTFINLYRETENLTWVETADLQRRARRRGHRRVAMIVSGAMVFGISGGIVAAQAHRGSPLPPTATAPPPATTSPAPSATGHPSTAPRPPATTVPTQPPAAHGPNIPAAAMLQDSDLPSRFRPAGNNLDGDWSFNSVTVYCDTTGSSQRSPTPVGERGRVFTDGRVSLLQRVQRFSVDGAKRQIGYVRSTVGACKPSPGKQFELVIVDEGFAGQDSVLVYADVEGVRNLWVFSRQGDLVTEIWQKGLTDRDEARRLATRAAARLCTGTDSC